MSHLGRSLHRRHRQIQQQHKHNAAINAFANAFDPVVNAVAEDEGNLDETMIDGNFDAISAGGMINWDNNVGKVGNGLKMLTRMVEEGMVMGVQTKMLMTSTIVFGTS